MTNPGKKGQGWHGNSDGHAKAGRKGGLARARNLKAKRQEKKDRQEIDDDMGPSFF